MTRTPEQMPFDLGHSTAYAPEDFRLSDCNRAALGWIERWPDWGAPALVLHGPAGSGKTHLARLWLARANGVAAANITDLSTDASAILIDDVTKNFIGNAAAEEALFHLWNRMKEKGGHLLLTAATPPRDWAVNLPDLKSRLTAAPAVEIQPPDDALMAVVLAKLFSDRQVMVPPEIIAFLLPRMERSFAAAATLVDRIDRKALAEKRPVTVPLVRALLTQAE